MCWERCFQVEDTETERFREIYDDFYRMGMEARRLKNMFGVNGTALMLDTTLAQFHATALNLVRVHHTFSRILNFLFVNVF